MLVLGEMTFLKISSSLLYMFLAVHQQISKKSLPLGQLTGKDHIPVFRRGVWKGTSCFPQTLVLKFNKPPLGDWKSSFNKNCLKEVYFARLKISQTYITNVFPNISKCHWFLNNNILSVLSRSEFRHHIFGLVN